MKTGNTSSPSIHPIIAGGISAFVTTILYQPLDFLKTQIQEPQNETYKRSVHSITRNTVQNYSLFRLWRGVIPSLFRAVPGGALYFYTLNEFKENIPKERQTPFVNGICGVLARGFADIIFFPFTLIKTQLESSRYTEIRMINLVRYIYSTSSLKGFYVGLLPTLVRDLPFSGIYYMSYRELKDAFLSDTNTTTNTSWLTSQASVSVTAGFIASLITHPADVIKTYRQIAPKDYKNVSSTIKIIINNEGLSAFSRGFLLRALRRTLVTATAWTLYESLLK